MKRGGSRAKIQRSKYAGSRLDIDKIDTVLASVASRRFVEYNTDNIIDVVACSATTLNSSPTSEIGFRLIAIIESTDNISPWQIYNSIYNSYPIATSVSIRHLTGRSGRNFCRFNRSLFAGARKSNIPFRIFTPYTRQNTLFRSFLLFLFYIYLSPPLFISFFSPFTIDPTYIPQ